MVDSPRDGGVLPVCLGVGCWGMNDFPAVLRLMNGRSLSVSDCSSFLGFRVGMDDCRTEMEVSREGSAGCLPFARAASRFRVVDLERTCRCSWQKVAFLPSILAEHLGNEQGISCLTEPWRWLVNDAVAAEATGLAVALVGVAD